MCSVGGAGEKGGGERRLTHGGPACVGSRRMAALDKRCVQLGKEKELIEKKMGRIEKAKETETVELRTQVGQPYAQRIATVCAMARCRPGLGAEPMNGAAWEASAA
jgi:hypothetical protein